MSIKSRLSKLEERKGKATTSDPPAYQVLLAEGGALVTFQSRRKAQVAEALPGCKTYETTSPDDWPEKVEEK
jgi:hypothetical protein